MKNQGVSGKKLPIIVDVMGRHYEVIIVIGPVVHLYTCSSRNCQMKGKSGKD